MMLNRRSVIGMGLLGCACCIGGNRVFAAAEGHGGADAHATPHWGYEGSAGPDHWGELKPEFKVCQYGVEQTPVDLQNGIKGDPGTLTVNYKPLPLRIVNNGHTIQVNADPGSACVINGTPYELLQFHFHHPSEHLLNGKAFDLECHFVHRSSEGDLAVIGVFCRPGAHNAALQPIFDAMPSKEGPEIKAPGLIDTSGLLPKDSNYFRYMGSLTTPPCSEGLTWTVYRQPIEASSDQIKKFAALFANNARPVQRINRRFLIESN